MIRIKSFLLIALFTVPAYSFTARDIPIYYYNLKFLKKSDSPIITQMIKVDKISSGEKILSKGVLFTYKNRKALNVSIGGNFNSWKSETMQKSNNGVWYFFLEGKKAAQKIEYKLNVDGIWIADPKNIKKRDDSFGSYISYINFTQEKEGRQITYRMLGKRTVEFRLYNQSADVISLVGDFNHWNPENDLMQKGNDGIWRLKKRLPRGTFRYRYIIDGEWSADIYNRESGTDTSGEICSFITLK